MNGAHRERKPRVTFSIGMHVPIEELIAEAAEVESAKRGRRISRNAFIVRAAERDARRLLRRPKDGGHVGERLAATG